MVPQRRIGSMLSNPRVIKNDLRMFLLGMCFFDELWKFLDFLVSMTCFVGHDVFLVMMNFNVRNTCVGLLLSGG